MTEGEWDRIISHMADNPPRALDHFLVAKTVQSNLPFSAELIDISKPFGDASNRRYYRLLLKSDHSPSLIVMQLADPEAFKASEEAVSGSTSVIEELPFVNVLGHLAGAGVRVPIFYYYDEAAGLLYLEDFGDLSLLQACEKGDAKDRERLYALAIDTLVHLHLKATPKRDNTCLAFGRSFDVPLLMWEFEHFLEYGVEARRGEGIPARDRDTIGREFQRIAEFLAKQPQVFTHRDYHSRNLMVTGEELGVIDFQDALLGPGTYDLASLLRDSYIELDDSLVDMMIDRYVHAMGQGVPDFEREAMLLSDPGSFRKLFDWTSLQRNLKAAGRFVYIDKVKHNPNFLGEIPRTLNYVYHNLSKYPEFDVLGEALTPYVPEWD